MSSREPGKNKISLSSLPLTKEERETIEAIQERARLRMEIANGT
jgi:hypothetical protein